MGIGSKGEKAKFLEVRVKESGERADKIRALLEEQKNIGAHKTLNAAAAAILLKVANNLIKIDQELKE